MARKARTAAEVSFGLALGKLFAGARMQRKLSCDQLAHLTGASTDAIRSIETGRTLSPGLYTSARLAMQLGVSLDDLTNSAMEAAKEARGD